MAMHIATDRYGDEWRFRTMSGLVSRFGGNDFKIEHDDAWQPVRRTVMILRRDKYGTHVVARLRIDQAALVAVGALPA